MKYGVKRVGGTAWVSFLCVMIVILFIQYPHSAGFVKQMGKLSWSSLKYLFNVKEKPNLDTEFLNKVQQNEFNQHLAQVHNLNDQGYCLEALSVGDKTGVFEVNPGLRKSIVQRFGMQHLVLRGKLVHTQLKQAQN